MTTLLSAVAVLGISCAPVRSDTALLLQNILDTSTRQLLDNVKAADTTNSEALSLAVEEITMIRLFVISNKLTTSGVPINVPSSTGTVLTCVSFCLGYGESFESVMVFFGGSTSDVSVVRSSNDLAPGQMLQGKRRDDTHYYQLRSAHVATTNTTKLNTSITNLVVSPLFGSCPVGYYLNHYGGGWASPSMIVSCGTYDGAFHSSNTYYIANYDAVYYKLRRPHEFEGRNCEVDVREQYRNMQRHGDSLNVLFELLKALGDTGIADAEKALAN